MPQYPCPFPTDPRLYIPLSLAPIERSSISFNESNQSHIPQPQQAHLANPHLIQQASAAQPSRVISQGVLGPQTELINFSGTYETGNNLEDPAVIEANNFRLLQVIQEQRRYQTFPSYPFLQQPPSYFPPLTSHTHPAQTFLPYGRDPIPQYQSAYQSEDLEDNLYPEITRDQSMTFDSGPTSKERLPTYSIQNPEELEAHSSIVALPEAIPFPGYSDQAITPMDALLPKADDPTIALDLTVEQDPSPSSSTSSLRNQSEWQIQLFQEAENAVNKFQLVLQKQPGGYSPNPMLLEAIENLKAGVAAQINGSHEGQNQKTSSSRHRRRPSHGIIKSQKGKQTHQIRPAPKSKPQLHKVWYFSNVRQSTIQNARNKRGILPSCVRENELSMQQRAANRKKDHEDRYPCIHGCGASFPYPDDFLKHINRDFYFLSYICDLGKVILTANQELACSRCQEKNPDSEHFAKYHGPGTCQDVADDPNSKAAYFVRKDRYTKHFSDFHPFLDSEIYRTKTTVLMFQPQCGYCGQIFDVFDDWMSHVTSQIKAREHIPERRGLVEWYDPWVGQPQWRKCNGEVDYMQHPAAQVTVNDGHPSHEEHGGGRNQSTRWNHSSNYTQANGHPSTGQYNMQSGSQYYSHRIDYEIPNLSGSLGKRKHSSLPDNELERTMRKARSHTTYISATPARPDDSKDELIRRLEQHWSDGPDTPMADLLTFKDVVSMVEIFDQARDPLLLAENQTLLLIRSQDAFMLRTVHSNQLRSERIGRDQRFPTRSVSSTQVPSPHMPSTQLRSMQIGSGGYAKVYKTVISGQYLPFVVKSVNRPWSERIVPEFSALRRLSHPNIVHMLGLSISPRDCSLLIVPVADYSLFDAIERFDKLRDRQAFDINVAHFRSIADALSYVHKMGIIHSDVKPSNILIQKSGDEENWLLSDFGSAQLDDGNSRVSYTPKFVAPEILEGKAVSPKSDVFSLGATILHTMLALYYPEKMKRVVRYSKELESTKDFLCQKSIPATNLGLSFYSDGVLELSLASLLRSDPEKRPSSHSVFAEMSKSLIYPPMAADTAEIRVLELLRGEEQDLIKCNLKVVSLSQCPQYDALSCCWTVMEKDQTILVNGKPFRICTNLYQAIKSIRCHIHSRRLWVDAICINQDSYSERSQQVPLMRQIYNGAHSLLVWAESRASYENTSRPSWKTCPETAPSPQSPTSHGNNLLTEDLPSEWWMDVLSSPWFDRRWTLSEIVLSPYATILYDGRAFKWRDLLLSVKRYLETGLPKPDALGDLTHQMKFLKVADDLGLMIKHPEQQMPLELAANFQAFACKDPRDRIYCLLGLAPEAFKELGVQVDYSKPLGDVFMQFSQAMLAHGNLDLLHFCSGESQQDFGVQLPSWVPSWTSSSWSWTSYKKRRSGILPPKESARNAVRVVEVAGVPALHLTGLILDRIAEPADYEVSTLSHKRLATMVADSVIRQDYIHPLFTPQGVRHPACPCRFFHDRKDYSYSPSSSIHSTFYDPSQVDSVLIRNFITRKSLFLTNKGLVGLGPRDTRPGDIVAIIYGTSLPLVLREDEKDPRHYTIIGDFCLPIPEYARFPATAPCEQQFVLI